MTVPVLQLKGGFRLKYRVMGSTCSGCGDKMRLAMCLLSLVQFSLGIWTHLRLWLLHLLCCSCRKRAIPALQLKYALKSLSPRFGFDFPPLLSNG
jgi:hypothetical protein